MLDIHSDMYIHVYILELTNTKHLKYIVSSIRRRDFFSEKVLNNKLNTYFIKMKILQEPYTLQYDCIRYKCTYYLFHVRILL